MCILALCGVFVFQMDPAYQINLIVYKSVTRNPVVQGQMQIQEQMPAPQMQVPQIQAPQSKTPVIVYQQPALASPSSTSPPQYVSLPWNEQNVYTPPGHQRSVFSVYP